VIVRPPHARAIDILCAGALLAIASPILAVAALLIRVTDGAPVLFRQQRLGRGRRPFQIIKLRTMTAGQVTPIGAVIRDLGVDELPQLINILRGEMALVGPRPLTEEDVRRVGWSAAGFDLRWAVPPGITGLAQIAPVRRCHPRTAWRLDRRYVLRQSARGDAAILAASALVPLLGKRRARLAARALAARNR
jgi:lipopolysaccharide/colanic/teichoic acid biosynthesis glycosyltransferase